MLLGVVATAALWTRFGAVWGLLTGFLLIGGLGWKVLLAIPGGLMSIFSRGSREFIRAWEARAGEIRFGEHSTYPPPGLYQAWRTDNKLSGVSASKWLDRMADEAHQDTISSTARVRGKGAYRGWMSATQYEGTVFGTDEGLVIDGESPVGEEMRMLVGWELFSQVRIRDRSGKAVMLFDPKDQDMIGGFAFIEVTDLLSGEGAWRSFVQGRIPVIDELSK